MSLIDDLLRAAGFQAVPGKFAAVSYLAAPPPPFIVSIEVGEDADGCCLLAIAVIHIPAGNVE